MQHTWTDCGFQVLVQFENGTDCRCWSARLEATCVKNGKRSASDSIHINYQVLMSATNSVC